mmetsp:Transcript_34381/g.94696  ORF Transcript_34381/g.94696 Transcript_34381/m.94696 type:complete len:305 (-) Transcript_34381:243-1157(-)
MSSKATHRSILGCCRSHFRISFARFSRTFAWSALTTPTTFSPPRSGVCPNSFGIPYSVSWLFTPSTSVSAFRQSEESTTAQRVFCTKCLSARMACGQKSIPARLSLELSPIKATRLPSTSIVRTCCAKSVRPCTDLSTPSMSRKIAFVGSAGGGIGSTHFLSSMRGATWVTVASGRSPYKAAKGSSTLARCPLEASPSPTSPSSRNRTLPGAMASRLALLSPSNVDSSTTSAPGPEPNDARASDCHFIGMCGSNRLPSRKVPWVLRKSTRNLLPSASWQIAACIREASSPLSLRSTPESARPIV